MGFLFPNLTQSRPTETCREEVMLVTIVLRLRRFKTPANSFQKNSVLQGTINKFLALSLSLSVLLAEAPTKCRSVVYQKLTWTNQHNSET